MNKKEILAKFKNIHSFRDDIISITNKEWFSLLQDEIRNSIAIEGIFANRADLISVLEKNKKSGKQKSAAILGYFDAANTVYEYALNLFKQKEFEVRISDLKQIHTLLMRYEKQSGFFKGSPGEFRKENVEVFDSKFTALHWIYINDALEVYIKWINKNLRKKNIDVIRLCALIHLLFETIHPFRDGNGRVGRIFLSYILIGMGYINIAIKGVKKSERDFYYNSLEFSDDQYEIMLRQVEIGKKISMELIEKHSAITNSSELENIIYKCLDSGVERLLKTLSDETYIEKYLPLREIAKYFNYSQDYLRNLINKGKLPAKRNGKIWLLQPNAIQKYIDSMEKNILPKYDL